MESNPQKNKSGKINCEYCGNNPVPHFIYWFFESLNILLSPVRQKLIKIFSFVSLPDFSLSLTKLAAFLHIVKFNEDINKCKVSRAKVLWEEAQKRGIKMKELLLFGKPFDTYIAYYPLPTTHYPLIFSGLPRPQNSDQAALDVMDDKAILKKKFVKAGLPVPKGGSVWNFVQAKTIFNKIEKPVIVKPRAGSRGRHSTTFVNSVNELSFAFKSAKKLCFWVVVEEQLFGPVYRATVINYQLCGVLRGDNPQVLGDGVNSITELIQIKNSQPHPGVKEIKIDSETEKFLARQNLKLTSVIEKNKLVSLSEKIGVNYGGSSSEDFEICHPDNKQLFVYAAKVVNDPIVGFDFIIPDITKSWKGQRCGFLEANSLPFINLHHNPLIGKPRNVAAKIWELVSKVTFDTKI